MCNKSNRDFNAHFVVFYKKKVNIIFKTRFLMTDLSKVKYPYVKFADTDTSAVYENSIFLCEISNTSRVWINYLSNYFFLFLLLFL